MSAHITTEIDQDTAATVVVYSTQSCNKCRQTKRAFESLGIEVQVESIEEHEAATPGFLDSLKAKLPAEERTRTQAPIVVVGDLDNPAMVWSGWQYDKIEVASGAAPA